MANTARRGKRAAVPKKSTARMKKKDTSLEDIESSMEKIALTDFAESTKEQLKKLGDKIHEATDKGVHVVKDIAEEVQRFAHDATELTKLKIEIHNLKEEREKLFTLMGEQLKNLYKSRKLTNVKKRFKSDFERLEELETALKEKENRISKLSFRKTKTG